MCSARLSSARSRYATGPSRRRPRSAHAGCAGQRRPDRIPPGDGRGRGGDDDRRLLRGQPRRPHRRLGAVDASGGRTGAESADRGRARRGRGRQRPDRARRAGCQRPVERGHRTGTGAILQPVVHAFCPARQPGRYRRGDHRARPRHPVRDRRRVRRRRDPPRAQPSLASAFLSPLLNRRSDEFGGSLENRAKVARGIVRAVRDEVRRDGTLAIAVTAKLNMSDGVRGGSRICLSLQTARWPQT